MKAAPTHLSPSTEALLSLLRAADSIWNASRLFFRPWGLSPSQFNIVNLLHDHPAGLSQSELGRLLIMHRSNVTGLVDRLEQAGLVSRREVALDRRAYRVVLTPAGAGLVAGILPEFYAAAERLWAVIPPRRLGVLTADLRKLGEAAPAVIAAPAGDPERTRSKGQERASTGD